MNTNTVKSASHEREASAINGWAMLIVNLALLIGAIAWFISIIVGVARTNDPSGLWWLIPAVLLEVLAIILLCGHFTLQPNEARVLILFGAYKGTVRTSGFWWANPFYARARARIPLPPGSVPAETVQAARNKPGFSHLMVDMALRELSEKGVVKLDEERKAAMVSNLLVVLCGESEASPVINTGTLYQ